MAPTTAQTTAPKPSRHRRGSVRPYHGRFRAQVSAGMDPITGELVILHEYAATEREAEAALEGVLAAADALMTERSVTVMMQAPG